MSTFCTDELFIVTTTRENIALLSAADNSDYSCIDENFQPESLQTWAKRSCVINAEMRQYRESVHAGVADDGYDVIDVDDSDDDDSKEVLEEVKAASEELYATECQAIAQAKICLTVNSRNCKNNAPKPKPKDNSSAKQNCHAVIKLKLPLIWSKEMMRAGIPNCGCIII